MVSGRSTVGALLIHGRGTGGPGRAEHASSRKQTAACLHGKSPPQNRGAGVGVGTRAVHLCCHEHAPSSRIPDRPHAFVCFETCRADTEESRQQANKALEAIRQKRGNVSDAHVETTSKGVGTDLRWASIMATTQSRANKLSDEVVRKDTQLEEVRSQVKRLEGKVRH